MYDALHTKKGFESQTVDLYPERTVPLAVQNRRNVRVDINNDSDGSWDEADATDGEATEDDHGLQEDDLQEYDVS